jgi:hypothetical protein
MAHARGKNAERSGRFLTDRRAELSHDAVPRCLLLLLANGFVARIIAISARRYSGRRAKFLQ